VKDTLRCNYHHKFDLSTRKRVLRPELDNLLGPDQYCSFYNMTTNSKTVVPQLFSERHLFERNRIELIRHLCRKTAVLSCRRCPIKTGVEKINNSLLIYNNFNHQMSLSKSKFWYSNNCSHFSKRVVPLAPTISDTNTSNLTLNIELKQKCWYSGIPAL
jgi:hypothetical protein